MQTERFKPFIPMLIGLAETGYSMFRSIISVILGLIAGFITVMIVEGVSSLMHPMPEGLDTTDMEAMAQFVKTLPASAFLMLILGHFLGAFAASFVATIICFENWRIKAIILGGFFLLAGLSMLFMLPHPKWFMIADLLTYFPGAWLGGKVVEMRRVTKIGFDDEPIGELPEE